MNDDQLPLCPFTGLDTLWLVTSRKSLVTVPWLYRMLARWIYFQIGWASDYSVEYQGVYTDEIAAIEACAGKPGWSYYGIPLNASLPEASCTFRCRDFPAADYKTRARYRGLTLPIMATPLVNVTALQDGVNELRKAIAGT